MRRAFDPGQPFIRITDDDPQTPVSDAERFARLARKAALVRCAKCQAVIEAPPGREWVCVRCQEDQYYARLRRPRTVYRGHIPLVKKMPRPAIDWKAIVLGGK